MSSFQYALIKAQAKEYVRQMQERLILKPVADRRLMSLKSVEAIEQQLMQMLKTWREQAPGLPGYVGGNTINLLRYLKCDVCCHDFSNLAVWQPYLRGLDLHKVNLASSDLRTSVFTEACIMAKRKK